MAKTDNPTLTKRYQLLVARNNKIERDIKSIKLRWRKSNRGQLDLRILEAEARVHFLADMVQVLVLKMTVLSEVSRLYPETYPTLLRSLDNPDLWWTRRKHKTINEWAGEMRATAGGITYLETTNGEQ